MTLTEIADQAAIPAASRVWPRRAVLAGSGAALLACAACGSKSTATSSASTTSTAAAANSSAAGGSPIASVSAIPADSGLIADAPSGKVILAKSNGKVVAHSAICTHQGAVIDGTGTCPLHGSKFNPATGAVINGPAGSPLAAVAVTEKDGKVYPA
ncbi:Ferredoxin subunit of nitrite reductase or a ring-hydroxylating dioxygenase [Nakamurella panacisegetis]|uniref:Cytochrome bc1 complex Rieske iron-sulfur subunit n=1 Tax=Nakamurella panacisegetis TaxID=1090615 RepID=A0A1H0J078_9ACTN|nr:Rieske (2Fe-2S) protein [Nakamurella panacisegetis]SDO37144.1 Ferredoxin subunit of nitrite reductase or a ring-hydroxylating dioxygenase [Nakamurella panacisegetis]